MFCKENALLRKGKRFYFSKDDNKAERDIFQTIWVQWTHEVVIKIKLANWWASSDPQMTLFIKKLMGMTG